MPTYQYACTSCDHRFEAVQSFSDASLTECPACTGTLRKVFSSVGIVFKGSGFYRTDSRAGAAGTVATADKGSSDNGSSDKGSSDKGSSDKGSSDKGSGDKSSAPAADKGKSSSTSTSSSSAPAAAAKS